MDIIIYYYSATRGGTLDANFESHNYLEVFDTRFDGTNGLPCVATTKHSEQTDSSVSFASVSWGHAAVKGILTPQISKFMFCSLKCNQYMERID